MSRIQDYPTQANPLGTDIIVLDRAATAGVPGPGGTTYNARIDALIAALGIPSASTTDAGKLIRVDASGNFVLATPTLKGPLVWHWDVAAIAAGSVSNEGVDLPAQFTTLTIDDPNTVVAPATSAEWSQGANSSVIIQQRFNSAGTAVYPRPETQLGWLYETVVSGAIIDSVPILWGPSWSGADSASRSVSLDVSHERQVRATYVDRNTSGQRNDDFRIQSNKSNENVPACTVNVYRLGHYFE